MRLTNQADYSFRLMIVLGQIRQDSPEPIPLSKLGKLLDISLNNLKKIAQLLHRLGYIDSVKGSKGGVFLAVAPDSVNLEKLLSEVEPVIELIDCNSPKCPLIPACKLKPVLNSALKAFLNEMGRYTLKDVLSPTTKDLIVKQMLH